MTQRARPIPSRTDRLTAIQGISQAINDIRSLLLRDAGNVLYPLLITGESGTGKSLIATTMPALGLHPEQPIITVSLESLPSIDDDSSLRVLWEYVDSVGRGSLLLDRLETASPALQDALTDLIKTRTFPSGKSGPRLPFEGRIIGMTRLNQISGQNRRKLKLSLYRTFKRRIYIPPLRKRLEDIPVLIDHFLEQINRERTSGLRMANATRDRLIRYRWTDNVRELELSIKEIASFSEQETTSILPEDLPSRFQSESATGFQNGFHLGENFKLARRRVVEAFERDFIWKHLKRNRYSVTATSKAIGITRESLSQKIRYYGLGKTCRQPEESDSSAITWPPPSSLFAEPPPDSPGGTED